MKITLITLLIVSSTLLQAQQTPNNFWMGRITGKLPYLEYGLGDDRLGGAKMTYLDTNIAVRVVDSIGGDYKLQLSERHYAYTPKTAVKRDSFLVHWAYYLTQNWRVYGDSAYDYVKINLDEKLPYKSIQQISPSRIVVDVYGATTNSNWITQLSSAQEIKNAYYEQIEDDVFRVIIELKHTQHWGHYIYYDSASTRLVIRVKRQPYPLAIRNLKIAIDAGHGGDNQGADGVRSHQLEKNLTLLFAKQLQQTLQESGVTNVFMTRVKDTSLTMVERIEMLHRYDPDVLISIHLNSSDDDTVRGVSTYYRYIGFRPLSQAILKQMMALDLAEYGNTGGFNFALNGPIEYPNTLVEVAFLSNREDEQRILDSNFRARVASRIMRGIQNWLAGMDEDSR